MQSKVKRCFVFRLLVLTLLSVVCMALVSCSRSSAGAAVKPAQAVGVVVAEATANLIPGPGQILLFTRDTSTYPNEMLDAQVKSFNASVNKDKRLNVAAIVKVGINFAEARVNPGDLLTRDQLFKALEDHPGLSGVVSFVGFPPLASQDVSTLRNLKCLAVFNSVEGIKIRQQIAHSGLSAVIVPRLQPVETGAQEVKSALERFNQFYVLIEPESDGRFSDESMSKLPDN